MLALQMPTGSARVWWVWEGPVCLQRPTGSSKVHGVTTDPPRLRGSTASPRVFRVFTCASTGSLRVLQVFVCPPGLQGSSGSSPVHWVSEGPLDLRLSTGLRGSDKMLEGLNRVSQGPPGHRLPTGSSRVRRVSGVFWVSQGPPPLQGSARLLRVYWVSEGPAPPGSVKSTGSGSSVRDVTSSSRCPPRDFVLPLSPT